MGRHSFVISLHIVYFAADATFFKAAIAQKSVILVPIHCNFGNDRKIGRFFEGLLVHVIF